MSEDQSFNVISYNQPPQTMTFVDQASGKVVFTLKPGGVLEAGPGLSDDEATRSLFASMVKIFPGLMRYMALAGDYENN